MLKRVDRAVYTSIEAIKNGSFKSGTTRFGLKDQGIDWAIDSNNQALITSDIKSKVDAIKAEIISGKIKVPDYYTNKK